MKYKDAVKLSMEKLAQDPRIFFIGYNLKFGSHAYGSLKNISPERIIETPVAENLMAGLGMGMSLMGFHPVVIYERQDFMLNALDNLVNHVDKIHELSKGDFTCPVITRAIVGSKFPINPGPQHMQDFTDALRSMLKFPIYAPKTPEEVISAYQKVINSTSPCLIVEYRDLYENEK
jgi:pyruvate/2-oxoglutarate/acetoin dehydrogenase E1 component